MQRVSASTSAGSIGGEHRDAQLVAAELAVGLGVDDPVGAQHLRDRGGVDGVVEVDGADDLAARGGVGDERRRVRRSSRPRCRAASDESAVRPVAQARPPWPFIHSTWLGEQARVATRRGVVGLVQAASCRSRSCRSRNVGDPAAGAPDLGHPVERGGRHQGEPQAAVGGEATSAGRSSRRRSRATSTGRPPAPRGRVDERRGRPSSAPVDAADRRHHAGRGLVVRPGVDVDAGLGLRRRARARLALDHDRVARGTARCCVTVANLRGELAEHQVLRRARGPG